MPKYNKRKDGRYGTSVMIGRKPDGRPDRKYLYAESEAELNEKLRKLYAELENNTYCKSSNMPLQDYIKEWLVSKSMLEYNTLQMYKNAVDKHINPDIGHLPLNKVHRSDIQNMIAERWEHRRTGEIIKMTLTQVFDSAIEDRLITVNPCKKITLPKAKPSNRRALNEIEKTAIKKADFTEQEKAFIYVLFYFGLRRGEAIALTASDVNLKRKMLTVNKSVFFKGNDPFIKSPKSDAGYREIPIPNSVIAFLRDYISKLDCIYLFTKRDGKMMTKQSLRCMWDSIIKKMNEAVCTKKELQIGSFKIMDLTPHMFRHNYCTMLYYSGISQKKAIELMGHSDITMIMKIYAHLDEQKEQVVEKLNAAINL